MAYVFVDVNGKSQRFEIADDVPFGLDFLLDQGVQFLFDNYEYGPEIEGPEEKGGKPIIKPRPPQ